METPKKSTVKKVTPEFANRYTPIIKKGDPVKKMQEDGSAFDNRQQKKIDRARTKAMVSKIEGEGSVADKRNARADRVAVIFGTKRDKVSRTYAPSTSTTKNITSDSGNTFNSTSSKADSGSTSQGGSGGTSKATVSESGNSSSNNAVETNSKNNSIKKMQKGGNIRTPNPLWDIMPKKKKIVKRVSPSSSKATVSKSGNSNSNNNISVGSGNTSIKRYQKGGSTAKVSKSGNSSSNNNINVGSGNKSSTVIKKPTPLVKKKPFPYKDVLKETMKFGVLGPLGYGVAKSLGYQKGGSVKKTTVPKAKMGGTKKNC